MSNVPFFYTTEITTRKKYFYEPLKDMMKESHLNTVKEENIFIFLF